jgi:hypothetical protein
MPPLRKVGLPLRAVKFIVEQWATHTCQVRAYLMSQGALGLHSNYREVFEALNDVISRFGRSRAARPGVSDDNATGVVRTRSQGSFYATSVRQAFGRNYR